MKHIILLFLLISVKCIGQEKALDSLFMISGEVLNVKVTKITDQEVTFVYQNETVENVEKKSRISKIVFSSGRIQNISSRIIIKDENDWTKVVITNVQDDVKGLINKGQVYGEGKGGLFGNVGGHNLQKIEEYTLEIIKREAAKKGAHIVFIHTKTMKPLEQNAAGNYTPAKVNITGAAYGYE
jgi:hypothetical protein